MRRLFLLTLFFSILLSSTVVWGSLSKKQAKKLISRMAGAQLPGGAVRLKRITETGSNAEATAEIETAFRLVQDKQGRWHVAEVRTGQDQWEEIPLLMAAAPGKISQEECTTSDLAPNRAGGDLSVKRARCLIASALRIELPSDAVRIRDVSDLGLPFSSRPSAVVTALIQADIRFSKDKGNWRVSDLRTGKGDWISLDALVEGLNQEKRKRAETELATIAQALENFRKDSGFYVASDRQPVLIDHLSPRYLAQIIRLDPWHKPYQYQGERDHFLLRSNGPDGKENTGDDIVVTGSFRRPS